MDEEVVRPSIKLRGKALLNGLTRLMLIVIILQGCGKPSIEPQNGGLFSVKTIGGEFRIIKVLASDPDNVYVCLYQNSYTSRPQSIDPSTLTLGQPQTRYFSNEKEYLFSKKRTAEEVQGYPLLPLSREELSNLQPVLLGQSTLTEEDIKNLENYKELKSRGHQ